MNKLSFLVILTFVIIVALFLLIINDLKNVEKQNKENNNKKLSEKANENMIMFLNVNGETLKVNLEDNSSVDKLTEKLKLNDITIKMSDYGNFEKVGELGFKLPTNDKKINTQPGDIILYQGDKITIYYGTNTWNFTKLGKIADINKEKLKEILGNGDVIVTFSLKN